jgi:site-specific recombinase XerD
VLKSFGTWLADQEFLPKNPFAKVKMPRVEKKLMPALPPPEVARVYQAIRDTAGERRGRDLALYSFMLESGARVEEVEKLSLGDLDLERLSAKLHGKGAKERLVYFTERTAGLLRHWLRERPQVAAPNVFLNLKTGRPLTTHGIRQLMRRYGQRAGLHCYPHLLRHTFATRYLINGDEKNLISLQKLLGHASLSQVQQYVDLLPLDVERQYRKFAPLNGLNLDEPWLPGATTPPPKPADTPATLSELYRRLALILAELEITLSAAKSLGAELPPEITSACGRLTSTLGQPTAAASARP